MVKFSIDGLSDTNHLYRRGVAWERVMRNAEAFLGAGGRAVWKFVVFPHNEHQVEVARKISERMGFTRFEARRNYEPARVNELYDPNLRRPESTDAEYSLELGAQEHGAKRVDCEALRASSIYLDFAGDIWPCCWIGAWNYSPTHAKRAWIQRHLGLPFGPGFNSLAKHSLSDILAHPWFRRHLPESWAEYHPSPGKAPHPACWQKCGTCHSATALSPSP
jgi:MoaA/NifB/PqqE/SkfB family radical SAM enzyme